MTRCVCEINYFFFNVDQSTPSIYVYKLLKSLYITSVTNWPFFMVLRSNKTNWYTLLEPNKVICVFLNVISMYSIKRIVYLSARLDVREFFSRRPLKTYAYQHTIKVNAKKLKGTKKTALILNKMFVGYFYRGK